MMHIKCLDQCLQPEYSVMMGKDGVRVGSVCTERREAKEYAALMYFRQLMCLMMYLYSSSVSSRNE